jgi:hypothetical protein
MYKYAFLSSCETQAYYQYNTSFGYVYLILKKIREARMNPAGDLTAAACPYLRVADRVRYF